MRNPRVVDCPDKFPWKEPTVPFICWFSGGFKYACSVEDKIEMLRLAREYKSCTGVRPFVMAVWPGKSRSDLFIVDTTTALFELTKPEVCSSNAGPGTTTRG